MKFTEQLNWRYATKRMNAEKIVSQEKINEIVEAIRLSASSFGLQPYNLLVVRDKELLKKIQPIANNQPQIIEASALLIFAVWDKASTERIDAYFNLLSTERGIPAQALEAYKGRVSGMAQNLGEAMTFNWMARQAYIALGTGLAAAAIAQVDSTPMEGFNTIQLDELLGLPAKGLKSVALLTLGYRDEANDPLLKLKKVRTPAEKFVIVL